MQDLRAGGERAPEPLLRTLGAVRLEGGAVRQPRQLLILSFLAVERRVSRGRLRELFWPDRDAANNLRVALSVLRRAHPHLLLEHDEEVEFSGASDVQALLGALREEDIEGIVSWYQGAFLADFRIAGSAELEEWILQTRESLADQVRLAALAHAETRLAENRSGAATLAEWAWTLPGSPPQPADLQRFYDILTATGSGLVGQVRREARGYELHLSASEGSPAPGAPPLRAHLPRASGPFVGRAHLVRQVQGALAGDDQLVTITGPGGIGKSRLALHLAHLERDAGRWSTVAFVPLEDVRDPAHVLPQLIRTLGLSPAPGSGVLETLRAAIRRPTLVVLDNFEHLSNSAPQLSALLRDVPTLHLIVTSRERLRLHSETVAVVGGMDLDAAAGPSEAAQLFVQQAQRAQLGRTFSAADLRAAQQVCELVGGVPLAIELAAAWIRLLSPQEIVQDLRAGLTLLDLPVRDLPERHRNLRSVFDHSWTLLEESERHALQNLSVFHGGFSRAAALAVSGVSLQTLLSLVDRSMLRVTENGRYHRLPLISQYSREQVADAALVDLERKHAAYFVEQSSAAFTAVMHGQDVQRWTDWIQDEWANLTASLEGADRRGEAQTVVWLCRNLLREWNNRCLLPDLHPPFRRALTRLPTGCESVRAWAQLIAEVFALALALPEPPGPAGRCGIDLARDAGDTLAVIYGLSVLDHRSQVCGDVALSMAVTGEMVQLAEAMGSPGLSAVAHHRRGSLALWAGDLTAARRDLGRSVELTAPDGISPFQAEALVTLAQFHVLTGDLREADRLLLAAGQHYAALRCRPELSVCHATRALVGLLGGRLPGRLLARQELQAARETFDTRTIPFLRDHVDGTGYALSIDGAYEDARRWFSDELVEASRVGHQRRELLAHLGAGDLAMRERDWVAAGTHFRFVSSVLWDTGMNVPLLMLALYGLAHVEFELERPVVASTLLAVAEQVRQEIGATLPRRLAAPQQRLSRRLGSLIAVDVSRQSSSSADLNLVLGAAQHTVKLSAGE